jgi:peptidoglycan/xylan/chitin deacetylase (PgdA/CDA1 family)
VSNSGSGPSNTDFPGADEETGGGCRLSPAARPPGPVVPRQPQLAGYGQLASDRQRTELQAGGPQAGGLEAPTGQDGPGGRERSPVVLMYHSVSPDTEDPYQVTVSPHRFEQQLRWLDRRGLRGVSMATLLAARARNCDAGLVGLTFDDGYDDFLRYALPALLRRGFTATAFVIAGRLGGVNAWDAQGPRKPLMTAAQVREVAAAGIEVGSHGLRHVTLSAITGLALLREQLLSRQILQDITGSSVGGFCYPYGHLNRRVRDGVQEAGYDYGCAIWRGELTGRHALPRVYVGEADGPAKLRAKWLRHRLTSRHTGEGGRPTSQLRRSA